MYRVDTSTDIPTKEPIVIDAGNTVKWKRDLSGHYDPATWTLTYTLINQSKKYTVAAVADDQQFSVTIASSVTKDYATGTYQLIGRVSDGSETWPVYDGFIEICPDLAALNIHDIRSNDKKILDALDTALLNRATSDPPASLTVGGISMSFTSWEEVQKAADTYRYRYEQETGQTTGKILMGFEQPS